MKKNSYSASSQTTSYKCFAVAVLITKVTQSQKRVPKKRVLGFEVAFELKKSKVVL